jgi:hypothetical protein
MLLPSLKENFRHYVSFPIDTIQQSHDFDATLVAVVHWTPMWLTAIRQTQLNIKTKEKETRNR